MNQPRASSNVAIALPYNAVFDDGPVTFEKFKDTVAALSRTDALFWCARLNLMFADMNLDDDQKEQRILEMIFSSEQRAARDRFIAKRDPAANQTMAINRGPLLELLRWIALFCTDHQDDKHSFNNPDTRTIFAKALLMVNDAWCERVFPKGALSTGDVVAEQRRNALVACRREAMETRTLDRPSDMLARGCTLFSEFMPMQNRDFIDQFREAAGMSINDYYDCAMLLLNFFINSPSKSGVGSLENSGIFSLRSIAKSVPHMKEAFTAYLKLQAQTPDDLKSALWKQGSLDSGLFEADYDLKPLRERPILKADDGRCIIIDPLLFLEQESVGPLFHVTRTKSQKEGDQLIAQFGAAFEAYAGSVFRRIYPDAESPLVNRLLCDVREKRDQTIQVADFVIDYAPDLVWIEAKGTLLRDDKTNPKKPKEYLSHLRERYKKEMDGRKGYNQLAHSINMLSSGKWGPEGFDLEQIKRIFPLLLVHDRLLDAHFHPWFFAEEFRELLCPELTDARGWMRKGAFQVAPLTLLTIDVLECLESSLSGFTLVQLLADYTSASPDRSTSLHDYLASNSERYPLQTNERLGVIASEMLDDCIHRLFPERARGIDSLYSPIGGREAAKGHRRAKRVGAVHGEVFA